ncbi:MAG: prolipoprotein diacylglyceryl transferase [Gammaproteobacteria bacterium]
MIQYPAIDPIAFSVGPLAIRWYGLSYIAGIVLGWWLLRRRGPHQGWDNDAIADLVFYVVLGVIIGGRLGSVLFYNLPYYLDNPFAVLKIWQGGMSFHGGLIGSLLAVWWFARSRGRTFFAATDFLAPVVPLGLCFGRIANFINGELWGKPTDLPWAMVFPDPAAGGLARHPSQLYQAALEGLLLFVILWIYSSRPRPTMAVSGLFLIGYGTLRFLVEFVREPDAQLGYLAFGWLTMGQLLCIPMILIGEWLLVMAYKKQRKVES